MSKKLIVLLFIMGLSMVFIIGCSNETTTEEDTEQQVESEEASNDDTDAEPHGEKADNQAETAEDIPDGFRVTTIGSGSPSTHDTKPGRLHLFSIRINIS